MYLDALYIKNFRNLAEVTLRPSPHFNVFEGQNGQGKTNLLEAIHFVAALKSFRGHPTRDLIAIDHTTAHLRARIAENNPSNPTTPTTVEVDLKGSRRNVRKNDNAVRKAADYFGTLHAVTFTPEDVGVFKAGPGERRTFFDRMIFNEIPTFADEMQRYENTLRNRNALLRDELPDPTLLGVYNRELAKSGAIIAARRIAFTTAFEPQLQSAFKEIFRSHDEVALSYNPTWLTHNPTATQPDLNHLEEGLLSALHDARQNDLRRGFTTVGPHRDDFTATLQQQAFKNFASQGQHRGLVLAAKITEIRSLAQTLGQQPILLMDDVSSELDAERNERLFAFVRTLKGQAFITTTQPDTLQLGQQPPTWHVENGNLTRTS